MTTNPVEPAGTARPSRRGFLWSALRGDVAAMISVVALTILVLVAMIAPFFISDLVTRQDLSNPTAAPGFGDGLWGLLGTDSLGRSVLARVIMAARTTLLIALCAVAISAVAGSVIGATVGYLGGWPEAVAMRVADVIMSFPSLLLALIVLYVFGPQATLIVVVLAITRLPVYLRTARARTRAIRDLPYVEAARGLGLGRARIVVRHGIPAVVPIVLALVTVELGLVMLIESSLTFLGIGVQPPQISWGALAAEGRGYLATAWWLSFFPGLAICLTVIAINIVSGWSRSVTDPKQRWRFIRDRAEQTDPGTRP
ncbi:ABC transporter permease [Jiangella muralis]|uniref:ABC transporter permease n=1 Tax=Jiangella muralis TaxID=702383 RepID=UPI00069E8305|nr:ABC transporter permease [Jiangella muralis]